MSKEPQQQMIIQEESELDEKLRSLMMRDSTVYTAYKTGELLGMSKLKLYANIILLLAAEKKTYFDMAAHAKSMETPTLLINKEDLCPLPNPHPLT